MAERPPTDGAEPTGPASGHLPVQWGNAINVIKLRPIDTTLWLTRLATIIFGILYLLPVIGSPVNFYYKALIANAATSALRLHQRLPVISFNRVFLNQLLTEDSCHYLFFSLIFLYCSPITLAIMPIFLYAILHFFSFSLVLLDAVGRNSVWIARIFISIIEYQTITLLRMIAGAEIFTMIFTVLYTFIGKASFLTPFVYYRFLTLRYSSRRNGYTRMMFYEIRIVMEKAANHPRCPSFFGSTILSVISFISRLAPPIPPPNAGS